MLLFFDHPEDQYAPKERDCVGDGGLVEEFRITQLRDAEGRLITFPNSEIKIVATPSSRWSRAMVHSGRIPPISTKLGSY